MAGLARVQQRFNAALLTLATLFSLGGGRGEAAAKKMAVGHPIAAKYLTSLDPVKMTRSRSRYVPSGSDTLINKSNSGIPRLGPGPLLSVGLLEARDRQGNCEGKAERMFDRHPGRVTHVRKPLFSGNVRYGKTSRLRSLLNRLTGRTR